MDTFINKARNACASHKKLFYAINIIMGISSCLEEAAIFPPLSLLYKIVRLMQAVSIYR